MDVRYWDRVAADYESAVLNPLEADLHGILRRRLSEFARPDGTACDYGCGPGRWLKGMARRFKQVHAVDFSAECLAQAKERCQSSRNITYEQRDLTRRSRKRRRFDSASCINVLLSPSSRVRLCILRHIQGELGSGGQLILVVPSLESGLFVEFVWREWDVVVGSRWGRDHKTHETDHVDAAHALRAGIMSTEGAPTKHYLKEELQVLLKKIGFTNIVIDKVEYPWSTEFESPPRVLQEPHPWDWLATARKT